jgi:uncharacterized protein
MTTRSITILLVEDLARSRRFYEQVFAWPVQVDAPVYVELAMPGGHCIGLYQRQASARNLGGQVPTPTPPGELSTTELYLHVDDVAASVERLRAAGARLLSPCAPRDWGDDAAYFADPDGNIVVVARPSEA